MSSKFLALFLVLSAFSSIASARLMYSAGFYQNNMLDLTQKDDGSSDTFGDTYLPLGLHYSLPFYGQSIFVPGINFTHLTTLIFPKETPEEGATKNLLFLSFPIVRNWSPSLNYKAGFGYYEYEIKGKGGTVQLNNGTGTSTFYKPKKTQTSKSLYALAGLSYIGSGWTIDFDLMVFGAGSDEKRSYNLYVFMSFPLGSDI